MKLKKITAAFLCFLMAFAAPLSAFAVDEIEEELEIGGYIEAAPEEPAENPEEITAEVVESPDEIEAEESAPSDEPEEEVTEAQDDEYEAEDTVSLAETIKEDMAAAEAPVVLETVKDSLTDAEGLVTVTGEVPVPEQVELVVAEIPYEKIASEIGADTAIAEETVVADILDTDAQVQAFDIKVQPKDKNLDEWQPDTTLDVTMDASGVGNPGEYVLVYHVHEDEYGNTYYEEPQLCQLDEYGNIVFEMSSFSYVLVVSSTIQYEDIKAFYTVDGTSGNNHVHAIAVFIDNDDCLHILFASNQANKALSSKAGTITVGDNTFYPEDSQTINYGRVSNIYYYDGTNVTDIRNLLVDSNYAYYIEIDLNTTVEINGQFGVSILWKGDRNYTAFSFGDMEAKIVFNEGINKTVYSIDDEVIDYETVPLGYIPTVENGKTVIYKIEVKNASDSTQATNMFDVVETFPACFDNSTVNVKIGENGTWANASIINGKITLESNVTLNVGAQKTYYVKATVDSDAQPDTYTNTASMVFGNGNHKDDTADIIVPAPRLVDLIIKKTVDTLDENQSFIFNIEGPVKMQVVIGYDDIKDGNETITIKDLPVGTYTVTEDTNWSWRYTAVCEGDTQRYINAGTTEVFIFTNTRSKTNWLDGDCFCDNYFKPVEADIRVRGDDDNDE